MLLFQVYVQMQDGCLETRLGGNSGARAIGFASHTQPVAVSCLAHGRSIYCPPIIPCLCKLCLLSVFLPSFLLFSCSEAGCCGSGPVGRSCEQEMLCYAQKGTK